MRAAPLRAYRAEDEPDVLRVWWESWHSISVGLTHPHPFEAWVTRWRGEIAGKQDIFVAELEHALAGFACVDREKLELTQLFVLPGHARRGIGGQLLNWAKTTLPDGFELSTLEENVASRAFYARHGLIEGERRGSLINRRSLIVCRWSP